jgi:4'-phosphopantetheinyl transferase
MRLQELKAPTPDEAHLWFACCEDFGREALETIFGWLPADERQQHDRLHRSEDRRRYLIGRLLTRGLLSRYLQQDPRSLRFVHSEHGRPELAPQPKSPSLNFNLSHAFGMVACCVTAGNSVGVDIEDLHRPVAALPIAMRFFAPIEAEDLRRRADDTRRRRFFEYWTLKEAYVKATGEGLSIPLNQFWFLLDENSPRVAFDARLRENPDHWQFECLEPTPQYLIGIAIRSLGHSRLRLVSRRWTPVTA